MAAAMRAAPLLNGKGFCLKAGFRLKPFALFAGKVNLAAHSLARKSRKMDLAAAR